MSDMSLSERIVQLEVKVNRHDKMLEEQSEKNETQIETNTLVRMYVETTKQLTEQMDKFSDTLIKVNENLTNLNSKQELLDERVTGIEFNLNENKIDPMKIFVRILAYGGTLIGGIIAAWLYMQLGLK